MRSAYDKDYANRRHENGPLGLSEMGEKDVPRGDAIDYGQARGYLALAKSNQELNLDDDYKGDSRAAFWGVNRPYYSLGNYDSDGPRRSSYDKDGPTYGHENGPNGNVEYGEKNYHGGDDRHAYGHGGGFGRRGGYRRHLELDLDDDGRRGGYGGNNRFNQGGYGRNNNFQNVRRFKPGVDVRRSYGYGGHGGLNQVNLGVGQGVHFGGGIPHFKTAGHRSNILGGFNGRSGGHGGRYGQGDRYGSGFQGQGFGRHGGGVRNQGGFGRQRGGYGDAVADIIRNAKRNSDHDYEAVGPLHRHQRDMQDYGYAAKDHGASGLNDKGLS